MGRKADLPQVSNRERIPPPGAESKVKRKYWTDWKSCFTCPLPDCHSSYHFDEEGEGKLAKKKTDSETIADCLDKIAKLQAEMKTEHDPKRRKNGGTLIAYYRKRLREVPTVTREQLLQAGITNAGPGTPEPKPPEEEPESTTVYEAPEMKIEEEPIMRRKKNVEPEPVEEAVQKAAEPEMPEPGPVEIAMIRKRREAVEEAVEEVPEAPAPAPEEEPEIMLVEEVAEFLRTDVELIRSLIRWGTLPAYHLSDTEKRVRREDLNLLYRRGDTE